MHTSIRITKLLKMILYFESEIELLKKMNRQK
jgi:hypothetical protein